MIDEMLIRDTNPVLSCGDDRQRHKPYFLNRDPRTMIVQELFSRSMSIRELHASYASASEGSIT